MYTCTRNASGRVPLGEIDTNTDYARHANKHSHTDVDTPKSNSTLSRDSEGSSLTPKSSPGSPMEVTPAPSSPASQHATPFRVPSLTPRMKETRHILPPQAMEHHGKLTVVFDLDETLVSNRRPGSAPAIARHYLKHMCRLLEGLVEVVLWTASTEETGRPVVRQIDPTGTFFHHVVFRNNKWFTDGVHTKDLTLLGRDMDRVLIVENTPNCCKLNPQNAIMVEDFRGDLTEVDRTLLGVATVIRGAAEAAKYATSTSRFLTKHVASPYSAIDVYELGLPHSYSHMTKEEQDLHVAKLDPLMRPPLGHYYYIKKN